MKKPFYVRVMKKNKEFPSYWYNEYVGHVFLVRSDPQNKSKYELVDGCAWLNKQDCREIGFKVWGELF